LDGIKEESIGKNAAALLEKIHSLWVEKYRPKNINELAASKEIKRFLTKAIADQDIPHILLHGKPGTGKNSIVNIIINNINCSKLIINASEERGIDTIRDKVMAFANSSAWGNKLKIIVLNEADGLNYVAQDSLRELMETSSKYCRFILTCNSINKINEAIRSRCVEFETHVEPLDAAKRLVEILEAENVEFDEDYIIAVVKKYNCDLRKIINESQKLYNTYGKLTRSILESDLADHYDKLFDDIFLKTATVKDIANATKKYIFDESIYTSLKDYFVKKYEDLPDAIIIIAEYAYKSRIVLDKDLAFLSCILELKEVINSKP